MTRAPGVPTVRYINRKRDNATGRRQIFDAALRLFAEQGYSGASMRDIVSMARLTKPTLYYHFKSKEGLFNALLDFAYDECHERMRMAASKVAGVENQLVEMLASVFCFLRERKDLTRLAFASAFAAPGEMPVSGNIKLKRRRNFEFVHGVIKEGLAAGALERRWKSRELANGIYGALSFHVMANLLLPGTRLDRTTAERIVSLFMRGAKADQPERVPGPRRTQRQTNE